jgi:hypothetical protein
MITLCCWLISIIQNLLLSIHADTLLKDLAGKIETLVKNWMKAISSGGYPSVLLGIPVKHIKAFVKAIQQFTLPMV